MVEVATQSKLPIWEEVVEGEDNVSIICLGSQLKQCFCLFVSFFFLFLLLRECQHKQHKLCMSFS